MTDPVTNALAVQLEYGEDELRQEIEARIAGIAINALQNIIDKKIREAFDEFKDYDTYIRKHEHTVYTIAKRAAQSVNCDALRALTGLH